MTAKTLTDFLLHNFVLVVKKSCSIIVQSCTEMLVKIFTGKVNQISTSFLFFVLKEFLYLFM